VQDGVDQGEEDEFLIGDFGLRIGVAGYGVEGGAEVGEEVEGEGERRRGERGR